MHTSTSTPIGHVAFRKGSLLSVPPALVASNAVNESADIAMPLHGSPPVAALGASVDPYALGENLNSLAGAGDHRYDLIGEPVCQVLLPQGILVVHYRGWRVPQNLEAVVLCLQSERLQGMNFLATRDLVCKA